VRRGPAAVGTPEPGERWPVAIGASESRAWWPTAVGVPEPGEQERGGGGHLFDHGSCVLPLAFNKNVSLLLIE
jgi:hypothetical protein